MCSVSVAAGLFTALTTRCGLIDERWLPGHYPSQKQVIAQPALPRTQSGRVCLLYQLMSSTHESTRLNVPWKMKQTQLVFLCWHTNSESARSDGCEREPLDRSTHYYGAK
jgi:hypothetical protein